jgi:hypothetical protein
MKNFIHISLALFGISTCVYSKDSRFTELEKSVIFSDEKLGIQFTYPKTWKPTKRPSSHFAIHRIFEGQGSSTLSFTIAKFSPKLRKQVQLMDLKDFEKLIGGELKRRFPSGKLGKAKPVVVGGHKATALKYQFTHENLDVAFKVEGQAILCMYGEYAYRIGFECMGEAITEKAWNDYRRIMSTFIFK